MPLGVWVVCCASGREGEQRWSSPAVQRSVLGASSVQAAAWPASGGSWNNRLRRGCFFFFFFLQREVLNSVLEETNSHLTQSFTIPWCNTPTYALSSYFSSSPAPAFISRSLSPTHSVCLARTLALRGNKPNEWAWLFEWVECSAHSPSVSLHISLATSPLSSLPSRRQISLLPPRAAAKHDNTVHPFTSPGPISLSYSSFSHEPSMSPPPPHPNPAPPPPPPSSYLQLHQRAIFSISCGKWKCSAGKTPSLC